MDFNEQLRALVCRLLDVETSVRLSEQYVQADTNTNDLRNAFSPKRQALMEMRPYYQVFAQQLGFLPDLSIVDLLFNMGPESIFWLQPQLCVGSASSDVATGSVGSSSTN